MKAYKFTISGYYFNSKREKVDFENVEGFLPAVDSDVAAMHLRSRFAPIWVKDAKDEAGNSRYPEKMEAIGQCHIDGQEDVEHEFSFIGKNIKEMSDMEIQTLCVYKDLRVTPLPARVSGTSLREIRITAYCEYSDAVLGTELLRKKDTAEFEWSALSPLVVAGNARRDYSAAASNEELLDIEMKKRTLGAPVKANMTLDDLKRMADERNITYHHRTGFDALWEKLFSEA